MADHPICPPSELVQQWLKSDNTFSEDLIVAAQWGADQELEACCEWFQEFHKTESWVKHDLKYFRAARRPKSKSLKQQALEAARIELVEGGKNAALIIKALEALPDD